LSVEKEGGRCQRKFPSYVRPKFRASKLVETWRFPSSSECQLPKEERFSLTLPTGNFLSPSPTTGNWH
jgi:hypothetical protein